MNRINLALLTFVIILIARNCDAVVIRFENFAPAGSQININPSQPYTEGGFTLKPTDSASAVFDSAASNQMLGNSTDWFGFAESNAPTLTLTTGTGPFSLGSVLIGPSTIASTSAISMTITGHLVGGGFVSNTFNGLSTATTGSLNWTNLASVDFATSDDAGLDDIQVNSVPEPATLVMLILGAVGVSTRRRWCAWRVSKLVNA